MVVEMEAEKKSEETPEKGAPAVKAKESGETFVEAFKQNLMGILIIARTDIIAHLKSPRMAILMVIFIFTVLSGAYFFAGMAADYTEAQPPEFLVWTYIVNLDDDTYPDDMLVITTDTTGKSIGDVTISLFHLNGTLYEKETTDEVGRTIFYDIDPQSYLNSHKGDYVEMYRPVITTEKQMYQFLSEMELYVQTQVADLDEDNVADDVAILVLNERLEPVPGATVSGGFDQDEESTNAYGLYREYNLLKDNYEYEITWNEVVAVDEAEILNDDMDIENLLNLQGPDDVLMQTAGLFIVMIVPIMAIGISFDTISREKISKSVVFLLSRPIGKRSIAAGKFIGSLTALAIPLTVISLVGVGIISMKTSESPSGGFVAGFLVITIVFTAIFVLLQQIFSTLAKTTGNAIMAGISIWLFFYIFFGLIILLINQLVGNQFLSTEYYELSNKLTLFSPTGTYGFLMVLISPTAGDTPIGITSWAPALSFTLGFVILFILSMELFRKRPYL
ncbi:MAG: ABC transporter permease [Thermoplasmata archaeon]|nr:MAG: ABC transporter permease [Thermoplasmata archaeon]